MDLRLFSASYPEVKAEAFAEWPEHMRREFALLVAEAGHSDAAVRSATGITAAALGRARDTSRLHALSFADFRVIDAEEERAAATKRRWKEKVRNA